MTTNETATYEEALNGASEEEAQEEKTTEQTEQPPEQAPEQQPEQAPEQTPLAQAPEQTEASEQSFARNPMMQIQVCQDYEMGPT